MQKFGALLTAWLCGLALTANLAVAQPAQSGLHDDLSGSTRQARFVKTGLLMGFAEAELAFDVAYEYKASTLMGEPILLCSARLTNPTGTVRFVRDRAVHEVEVTPEMAELINPHHLDLLVSYPVSYGRSVISKCSTGIPGTATRDPLNLATSPSWGAFLCDVPDGLAGFVLQLQRSGRPHPDMLDQNWCTGYGLKLLAVDEAQALFRNSELRADQVWFGSLSVNVGDLVQEAGRRMTAAAVADQLAEALYQAGPATADLVGDPAINARWQAIRGKRDEQISAAASLPDERIRARAMQEAVRDALRLQIDPEEPDGAGVRAYQADLASRLSSLEFQSFAAAERAITESLDASAGEASAHAEQAMADARAKIAGAPHFRFANDTLSDAPDASLTSASGVETYPGTPCGARIKTGMSLPVTDQDYINNGNGTATHRATNVTWARCALGMYFVKEDPDLKHSMCHDITPHQGLHFSFEDARQAASEFEIDGIGGWRLPTLDELNSIVEPACTGGFVANADIFTGAKWTSYWTSTPHPQGNARYVVNLGQDGFVGFMNEGGRQNVLVVRD